MGNSSNAKPIVDGAVAQLGERVVRNDEVVGSIPISSIFLPGLPGQEK